MHSVPSLEEAVRSVGQSRAGSTTDERTSRMALAVEAYDAEAITAAGLVHLHCFAQDGVASVAPSRSRGAGLVHTCVDTAGLSRMRSRHVQAKEPGDGELVCVDRFYVGTLKRVGICGGSWHTMLQARVR